MSQGEVSGTDFSSCQSYQTHSLHQEWHEPPGDANQLQITDFNTQICIGSVVSYKIVWSRCCCCDLKLNSIRQNGLSSSSLCFWRNTGELIWLRNSPRGVSFAMLPAVSILCVFIIVWNTEFSRRPAGSRTSAAMLRELPCFKRCLRGGGEGWEFCPSIIHLCVWIYQNFCSTLVRWKYSLEWKDCYEWSYPISPRRLRDRLTFQQAITRICYEDVKGTYTIWPSTGATAWNSEDNFNLNTQKFHFEGLWLTPQLFFWIFLFIFSLHF